MSICLQYIVQRLLVAKSISHAQGAGLMVGVLKVLPFFLMVLPGMISKLLHPGKFGRKTTSEELKKVNVNCDFISLVSFRCTDMIF